MSLLHHLLKLHFACASRLSGKPLATLVDAILIRSHFRSGTAVIRYVGSLTKRGAVPPGERIEITAKASTLSPGIFELFSWELTAEVGIEQDGQWIEQARYVETDAGGPLEVEVVASPEPLLI